MSGIRLGKLPDRTPVKMAISVMPDLHLRLVDYATAYRDTYGIEEQVAELIPAMLAAFLDSDRVFASRRKPRGPAA